MVLSLNFNLSRVIKSLNLVLTTPGVIYINININIMININDHFTFARFTKKDSSNSCFTEHTSITIHGTVFH